MGAAVLVFGSTLDMYVLVDLLLFFTFMCNAHNLWKQNLQFRPNAFCSMFLVTRTHGFWPKPKKKEQNLISDSVKVHNDHAHSAHGPACIHYVCQGCGQHNRSVVYVIKLIYLSLVMKSYYFMGLLVHDCPQGVVCIDLAILAWPDPVTALAMLSQVSETVRS